MVSAWNGLDIPALEGFTGFVPPAGTGSSHVALVGEAPGEMEARYGVPFYEQAPAGAVLSRLLRRAGLERDAFAITNAVWSRPPGNYLDGARHEGQAIAAYGPFRDKFFDTYRPRVLVALGGVALRTLTPYGGKGASITNVMGYVLDGPWDGTFVIPAIHPSAILRGEQRMSGVVIWALQRAMDIARNGFTRLPARYVTHPDLEAALEFERAYQPDSHFLSYDIETAESSRLDEEQVEEQDEAISYNITRISLCYSGADGYAISLPWQPPYIAVAKRMLSGRGAKRVWNGNFDNPRLAAAGCPVQGRIYDSMWAWKFLQPTLPRSLGFVAPFYGWTGEPWKHTSDSEPERYSAADAHALQLIADGVDEHLRQKQQWHVYERHVVDLGEVLTKMSANGLPYSAERAAAFEAELQLKWDERKQALALRIPPELCRPKQKTGYKKLPKDTIGLSRRKFYVLATDMTIEEHLAFTNTHDATLPDSDQMIVQVERWCQLTPFNPGSPGEAGQVADFVKHFGHSIGTNRKTKRGTVDDEHLKKLAKKVAASKRPRDIEFRELLQVIRECRQLAKVLGTYVNGWRPGRDGRIHATPGFWGAMFRISWRRPNISATIQDKIEGAIARGFRKCVAAQPGRVLLEADYKGMEGVLVGWFADDADYMRLAKIGVHDYFCAHVLAAKGRIPASEIPSLALPDAELKPIFFALRRRFPKDRDDAKHVIHGQNYGMGTRLMSDMFEMPESECKRLQAIYFDLFPKIRSWQRSVLDRASRECKLRNPFGYEMPFWEVFRWDSKRAVWALGEDAKSAIAFLPRDTGAAMLKEVLLRLAERHSLATSGVMLASTHDSILAEVANADVDRIAHILHDEMTAPVPELSGLTIPVELKAGESWHDDAMESYELSPQVPAFTH